MGILNSVKNVFGNKNNAQNQQQVGSFDVNQQVMQPNYAQQPIQNLQPQYIQPVSQQPIYQQPVSQQPQYVQQPQVAPIDTFAYQQQMIQNNPTAAANSMTFTPRPRNDRSREEMLKNTPVFHKVNGKVVMRENYSAYDKEVEDTMRLQQNQAINSYGNQYQQPIYQQPPVVENYHPQQPHQRRRKTPNEYFNNQAYNQQGLDFDKTMPIEYGNYQDFDAMNQDHYYSVAEHDYPMNNYGHENQLNNDYNQYMGDYGYSRQSREKQNLIPSNNYAGNYINPSNEYNASYNESYSKRMKYSNIIPNQIAREIRSEKMRVAIMFIVGIIGITFTSIMLAAYYTLQNNPDMKIFAGFTSDKVLYPLFSIFFLIISVALFLLSITDYSLLYANVKKYERELMMGRENVPYFITRNYRTILSRSVYVTWIAFTTYVCGAISLGILYALQAAVDSAAVNGKEADFYLFFWKIGTVKSVHAEITTNIVVLIATLGIHIGNIIWGRSRKNNIISYYGYEIIPPQEIKEIKKKANTICMVIFFILLAIVLFAIVIPWLIIRKRKGKPLTPWGFRR